MSTKTQPTYLQSDELSRQPVRGSLSILLSFGERCLFFFFFLFLSRKIIIQFFSICAEISVVSRIQLRAVKLSCKEFVLYVGK